MFRRGPRCGRHAIGQGLAGESDDRYEANDPGPATGHLKVMLQNSHVEMPGGPPRIGGLQAQPYGPPRILIIWELLPKKFPYDSTLLELDDFKIQRGGLQCELLLRTALPR